MNLDAVSNQDVSESQPQTLCKFRPYGDESSKAAKHLYQLLSGSLWFSKVVDFNDPFEARPSILPASDDPEILRAELARFLESGAIGQRPFNSPADRRSWAEGLVADINPDSQILELEKKLRLDLQNQDLLVYCASHPSTESMPLQWAHYADAHKGVCVHLDATKPPLITAQEVEYSEHYPSFKFPLKPSSIHDVMKKSLVTKSVDWKYEREFRALRPPLQGRDEAKELFVTWAGNMAMCDPTIVKSMTLGCKMSREFRDRLIEWVKENAPHVEVWESVMHRNQFSLERRRL